jgi:F420-dependent hydroxymycolic acid dehydrogenase
LHSPAIFYVLASEQFPIEKLVEYGVAAERAGFDGVWTSDHFQPWQDNEGHSSLAWLTLAALSQRTQKVTMGTGVTCPTFRYRPATVAEAWASLSALAPGRIFLGVGSGEKLNEGAAGGGWADYKERAERLIEATKIIRSLWSGNHVKLDGDFWKVEGKLYDKPAFQIPLYIAAGGKKSARLAGKYGDGLVTGSKLLKELKPSFEKGAMEEGKDPSKLAIVVEHWMFVGEKKAAEQAASLWRFIPKAWEEGYHDNISPEDIRSRAEKEIPLEEAMKDWTVSIDPKEHEKAIRELAEQGATHVVLHTAASDQVKQIEFLGRELLPMF